MNRNVTLAIPNGLHLSPITRIVQAAGGFDCSVSMKFDGKTADARSVYDLMLLGATQGAPLILTAEGSEAESCVEAIVAILENLAGESRE